MTESDFVRPPVAPPGPPVAPPYPPVVAPYPPYPVVVYPPPVIPVRPKIFLPTTLKDHMRFFQVPARRWWWSLIGLVAFGAIMFAEMLIASAVVAIMDPESLESEQVTPAIFLANNVLIATHIAVAVLVSWLFFRQGFGWLVSVVGRFRWKWMALALGVFAAGYAVTLAVEVAVYGPEDYGLHDLRMLPTTWVMVVGILVTTPFQCAGEEFTDRAVLPRLVAGIVPIRWLGLLLSAVVSSGLFVFMHGAADIWLNIYYFGAGLILWWLAYRTGGIEASIALHIVNNLFNEWMLPFSDISDIFDRGEGAGSPMLMVYLSIQLVLVLIVDSMARRRGLVRMSSPAAAAPEVVQPRRLCTRLAGAARPATAEDLPRMASTVRDIPLQWPPTPPMPAYGPPPTPPGHGLSPAASGQIPDPPPPPPGWPNRMEA